MVRKACLHRELLVNKIAMVWTWFCCVICAPTNTSAHEPSEQAVAVCVELWDPYLGVNDEGKLTGPAIDIINGAFRRIGKIPAYIIQSDTRCDILLNAGRAVARFPVDANEHNIMLVNRPLAIWRIVALVRQSSGHSRFQNLSQFEGQNILSVRDHFYPEPIHSWLRTQPQLEIITAYATGIMKLLRYQRVDVVFDDEAWLQLELKRDQRQDLTVLSPPVSIVPQYLGVAPKHKPLLTELNRAFDMMASETAFMDAYLNVPGLSPETVSRLTERHDHLFSD